DVVFNVAFVAAVALAAFVLPPDGRSAGLLLAGSAILVLAGLWYARVTPRATGSLADRPTSDAAPPPPAPDPAAPGPGAARGGGGTPGRRPGRGARPGRP